MALMTCGMDIEESETTGWMHIRLAIIKRHKWARRSIGGIAHFAKDFTLHIWFLYPKQLFAPSEHR